MLVLSTSTTVTATKKNTRSVLGTFRSTHESGIYTQGVLKLTTIPTTLDIVGYFTATFDRPTLIQINGGTAAEVKGVVTLPMTATLTLTSLAGASGEQFVPYVAALD